MDRPSYVYIFAINRQENTEPEIQDIPTAASDILDDAAFICLSGVKTVTGRSKAAIYQLIFTI
jgi:hypothetical protein